MYASQLIHADLADRALHQQLDSLPVDVEGPLDVDLADPLRSILHELMGGPLASSLASSRAGLMTLALHSPRTSKIDRHGDLTPSPSAQEQRILMRARSRKLHAFWSAVLVRIETETDERRNTPPARTAQLMATPSNDARAQD
jgi:hypothetical protein